MAIPYYMTAVDGLLHEIDQLLSSFVSEGYHHLANYLRTPLLSAMTLYVVISAWMAVMGWSNQSLSNLFKAVVKLGLISLAALNWSWFSQVFYGLLVTAAGQVGDALLHATPIPIPHFAGEGIDGGLQTVLIELTKIGVWTWVTGSWHNIGPYINALLIWGFGFSLLFIGLFECVLAKVMLAVLLATAPLFIGFTVFKVTQSLFDRWLGACIGFSLLLVLISSVLALILNLADWAIAGVYQSHATHLKLVGFVPVMMIAVIGIGIILKTAQLAHGIAGNVSTVSSQSLWAGVVGGFVGSSLRMMRYSKKGDRRNEPRPKENNSNEQAVLAVRVRLYQAES